jgi:hypothetical protein
MAVLEAPVSTPLYADMFAHRLAVTTPVTAEHLVAMDAYMLATAVAAGDVALQPTAEQLNTEYICGLASALGEMGVPGLVVPLGWNKADWRRQSRITAAGLYVQDGGDPGGWHGVLDGLAAGRITIRDRRNPRRFTAFLVRA